MSKINLARALLAGSVIIAAAGTVQAATIDDIRITEFMYNPNSGTGEFVEFTNLGSTAVNMNGWSEDDSTESSGKSGHELSGFGVVAPGQSVIFTESTPDAFRAAWNLSSSVAVIGPYSNDNLGRADEINLYDASGALVDRLTYNDQAGQGPRAAGVSAVPGSVAAIGANNASLWVLSTIGNADGAYASTDGDIGSPGTSSFAPPPAPVPLPAAAWLLMSGLGALTPALRRRKQAA